MFPVVTIARVPGVVAHLGRFVRHLQVVCTLCFVLAPDLPLSSEPIYSCSNIDDAHIHSYAHIILICLYLYPCMYLYLHK